MKRPLKSLVCLAGGLALSLGAQPPAAPLHDPYQGIVMRNTFGLTPTAPAGPATPPSDSASVKIMPNGITTILGSLQVLFTTVDIRGGQKKSHLLSEGQAEDGVEIVRINQMTAMITFNNHGVRQEIALPEGSVTAPPAPAADDAPRSFHHVEIPRPGGLGSGIPAYLGGDDNTGQGSGAALTRDQQILMIEAQRAYYKSQTDPASRRLAASLPPTSMTPPDAFESSSAESAPPPAGP